MRRMVTSLLAVAAIGVVSGCAPDVSRERIEADVSPAYSHQLDLSRAYAGKSPAHVKPSAECHRSGEHKGDKGPGSWGCELKYPDPDKPGKSADVFEVVLVSGDACYQGLNPDLNDKPTIRDVRNGRTMPNPLFQFDSCLNVYDGHDSTTR